MFRIRDIDHVVLRVSDLERMIAFYCDVVACSVEWRRPDLGLVHLRAGGAMIDLLPVDGPLGRAGGAAPGKEGRNVDHICLRIDPFDVDDILAHLHAHGAQAVGEVRPRFGAQGEGLSIYLRDPEDNLIELKGVLDRSTVAPQSDEAKA
jgi:catechol 2,3-dioxygenase-like lactoylglutathione lyase family enzyme